MPFDDHHPSTGAFSPHHAQGALPDTPLGARIAGDHATFATRAAHDILRTDRYADLSLDSGDDVTFWFKAADGVTDPRDGDRRLHWRIDGSALGRDDFLLLVNMDDRPVEFAIPRPAAGRRWWRTLDTAAWAEPVGNCWTDDAAEAMGDRYVVHPFTIAAFRERRDV